MKKNNFLLLIIILLGCALRLDFLFASNFRIDSDEAIVGLMAKHILEGKNIPIFYYGQHYMGSFESIMVAALSLFFGLSTVTLRLVPTICSIVLIPVAYKLAKLVSPKNISNEFVGLTTALFFALPPSALLEWSTKARGGFIEVLLISALSFLYLVKFVKKDVCTKDLYFSCFLLGVGWWVNNQILYSMIAWAITAGIFLLISYKIVDTVKITVISAVAWLIGSSPWWVYNILNDWVSLGMFESGTKEEIFKHIAGVFAISLPILHGGIRFWHHDEIFPGAKYFVFANLILCLIAVLYLIVSNCFNKKEIIPVILITVFPIICITIFSISSFGYLIEAPRYLLPIYVGTFVWQGLFAGVLFSRFKILSYIYVSSIIIIQLTSFYLNGRSIPGEPFVYSNDRASKDHTNLIRWLKENNISHVRANYWIGYRLAFETNEAVTFTLFGEPYRDRIPEYERINDFLNIPIISTHSQIGLIKDGFNAVGIKYKETKIDDYTIMTPTEFINKKTCKSISPKNFSAETNYNQSSSRAAFDGSIDTRWGAGHEQIPGMYYILNLGKVYNLCDLELKLGKFRTDAPAELRIKIYNNGALVKELTQLDTDGYDYLEAAGIDLPLYLDGVSADKIELLQEGKKAVFDWSIAEIVLQE